LLRPLPFQLFVLFVLAFGTACIANPAEDKKVSGLENAVILIIRHAEKPDTGHGLSPTGDARADACASYFANIVIDGRPLKLDHIFATKDTHNSHRPRLTVEPTAQKFGLKIDDRFKIPRLLRALGADPQKLLPNGKWPADSFGWLIQLRYDQNGLLVESKRVDACPLSSE